MTTALSLILALMLSMGGSPAGVPGNTGIQAPVDNSCAINPIFKDYTQKTASRADSKKILKIVFIDQPKTQIRLMFTLPLKEKLHLVGYEDSMNLYQAFNMNPINFTDPFGQFIDSPTPGTLYKNDPDAGFWGLTWEGSSKGMYEHGGEALAFGTLLTADAIAVPFDKALDVIDWAAQKTGVAQFFGFDPGETKEVVGLTAILLAGQPETAMVSTAARARLAGFGGKYFGRVKNFLQNILPRSKAIDLVDEITDVSKIRTKLSYNPINKSWESPGGLIYGQGSKHGNRIKHIFEHLKPDPTKPKHSLFNVDRNKLIDLLDEAWSKKGQYEVHPNSGNWNYIIDMGRQIGTKGERKIVIAVKPGTSEIVSAFPK